MRLLDILSMSTVHPWKMEKDMAGLKQYFLSRIGGKLQHSADGPRVGMRRDYEATVRGVDRDTLLASVIWTDIDREGRKVPGSRVEPRSARTLLRGLENPSQVIEDLVRNADPDFYVGKPVVVRDTGAAEADAIEHRLAQLSTPEGRGQGEATPLTGSVHRLRAFWNATPNLIAPDIFSSADGTLRARWNHGHNRTLWINFSPKGPLGWTASVPRDGNSGLCKVNARCVDEQDILQCAALMGIRCTR